MPIGAQPLGLSGAVWCVLGISNRLPHCYDFGPDYADPEFSPTHQQTFEWSYDLGSIVTAFVDAGLRIDFLREHDVLVYQGIKGLERSEDGYWRMPSASPRIPLSFYMMATKPEA